MAIQGDIRDLDIPLLISTATFNRGVIEVECPPLGTVMVYFRDGRIVSVSRNGELLENILEVLDTLLSVIRCRSGSFMMENLNGTDVDIPETVSMDANQLTLWLSSLIDEINNRPKDIPDDALLKLVPGKYKGLKENLSVSFILLAMEYLLNGTTLKELRKNLPLRDDTLEYFVSRLVSEGVIYVSKPTYKKPPPRIREAKPIRVFIHSEVDDVRDTVVEVLKDMGYDPKVAEGSSPPPNADLYVADLNGKGFIWASSLFGPFASRTILVGSEDINPARFLYLRKPVSPDTLREAIERIVGQNI